MIQNQKDSLGPRTRSARAASIRSACTLTTGATRPASSSTPWLAPFAHPSHPYARPS